VGLGLADEAGDDVSGDPEAVAVDDPEAAPPCAVEVPLGTACFAQIATTTVLPDSSALPPSPDRSEK
jgi:hypothetical protein